MDSEAPRPFAQRGELGRGWRRCEDTEAYGQTDGADDLANTGTEQPGYRLYPRRTAVEAKDVEQLFERAADRSAREQNVADFMRGGEGASPCIAAHGCRHRELEFIEERVAQRFDRSVVAHAALDEDAGVFVLGKRMEDIVADPDRRLLALDEHAALVGMNDEIEVIVDPRRDPGRNSRRGRNAMRGRPPVADR